MALGLGLLVTAPLTIWSDAYKIEEKGISVPTAGSYAVWTWAPPTDTEPAYHWVNSGVRELSAGAVDIKLEPGAAGIVLASDTAFDPNLVIADRRVYDQPQAVDDRRQAHPRHTDYVYTAREFRDREAWETFAAELRRRILIGSGLFPLPERTPLNPNVFGRIEHDGYSVEKVHFEAWPGFLCTGNLYRPLGEGPYPAIATPHGHWDTGRLENTDLASIPGRCISLARMGIVAFSYDMIGYNDSLQFPHDWGSPELNLWGIHPFAMQLWTSIRVLDFLEGQPYVDPERLGCTGASGGGTQTFALMAIDPRLKAAAPVNMISRSMQGGCLCENAPLLRLHNSNIEIGGLMAPKPLLMISATGDWTVETPLYEYPAIKRIYALYGADDALSQRQIDAPHNYNKLSRETMYRFFGKWLLDQAKDWSTFEEQPFDIDSIENLRVFPDGKLPEGTPSKDQIIATVRDRIGAKWQAILPKDEAHRESFRNEYGVALGQALSTTIPVADDLDPERLARDSRDGYILERWVIRRPAHGDAIPALVYVPRVDHPVDAVLLAHGDGKEALANPAGAGPGELVRALMETGKMVMVIDLYLQGEHHSPMTRTAVPQVGRFIDRLEVRANETFSPTEAAYRVQDLLTAAAYLRSRLDSTGAVNLAGLGNAGMDALFAAALDQRVERVWVDFAGFDSDDDAAWSEKFYVPGIRSIGDVATAAALVAPRDMFVANAPESTRAAVAASALAGGHVHIQSADKTDSVAIVEALR